MSDNDLSKKELSFLKPLAELCKKHKVRLLDGRLEFFGKDLEVLSHIRFGCIAQHGLDYAREEPPTPEHEMTIVEGL